MTGFLLVEHGPQRGKTFALKGDEVIVGRSVRNDIVLDDSEVSAVHCRLVRVLDDYEIHDSNSTNGTFVNERRVGEEGFMLAHGHRIQIGDTVLLYLNSESVGRHVITPDAPPPRGYLVIKRRDDEMPHIYQLDRPEFRLGRDATLGVNDIVLADSEVSRSHLRVVVSEEGLAIEDLGSTNGTQINGQPIPPYQLFRVQFNDHICLGETVDLWYVYDTTAWGVTVRTQARLGTKDDTLHARPPQIDIRPNTISTEEYSLLMSPPRAIDCFITYQREDWDALVLPLLRYLWDAELRVWVDQLYSPNTPPWRAAIEQARLESRTLLVVTSQHGVTPQQLSHANYFTARNKPVYVLRQAESSQLPLTMGRLPRVTYTAESPRTAFSAIHRLIRRSTGILKPEG
ncbi:MAG: FHA domain-containing protein [Anaerolineae bacterium]|nr:FHA domain-containing protein [Anaerolineae bacterium]MDW8171912.1 FHA domain-containing protein [Anaerolineae bacterium]